MNRRSQSLGLALLLAVLFVAGCASRASKLEVFGTVPRFHMIDSQGRPFDSGSLRGTVWVADFIYTSCPAECPLMSSKMRAIEKRVRGQENVRLVSISVDPARDTPPVLDEFAHRFGGPNDQWTFLTGTPETVHQVAFTTFHVGDVIGTIEHSTKFVLVDKQGRIRGYYSSLDSEGMDTLGRDLATLRGEPAA